MLQVADGSTVVTTNGLNCINFLWVMLCGDVDHSLFLSYDVLGGWTWLLDLALVDGRFHLTFAMTLYSLFFA
jgi:hypothetical protein